MEGEGGNDAARRRKATQTTKVKVVASRYAQALQKSNLEAKAPTKRATSVESASNGGRATTSARSTSVSTAKVSSMRSQSSRSAPPTQTIAAPTAAVPSGLARPPPSPATPAVSISSNTQSSGGSASSAMSQLDINERLRRYRENKQRATNKSPTKRTARSGSLGLDQARPSVPERIVVPQDRPAAKPAARTASRALPETPTKRRMIAPTDRGTPKKSSRQLNSTSIQHTSASTGASHSRVAAPHSEEELELLESLYYQLCFTEAKAQDTFHRQEKSAERQISTAWNLLQSKLQLFHDTSMRLDRELHIQRVENHLIDQAEPFIQLASRLPTLTRDLDVLCQSLKASLQRMPTPGVVCSPPELKRQLENFAAELNGLVSQLNEDTSRATMTNALTFENGMGETIERACGLLMQVGHLLEELQQEVNTETSLVVHRIQEQRLEATMRSAEWW